MDYFINIPNKADKILRTLREEGFSSYVVGGCVRDMLLGRIPDDWDIATSATPEEVKRVFTGSAEAASPKVVETGIRHGTDTQVIETGIKHGTVTLVMGNDQYEITTFRKDGPYSDGRHPDSVEYSSDIKEDLARRDFTMNALAYSPDKGIVDEFGGIDDIKSHVIRAVGDPVKRFTEDRLRVLRGIRFVSQLGFSLEASTAAAVRDMAPEVDCAPERVKAELDKLLMGAYAEPAIRKYRKELDSIISFSGAHISDRKSVKSLEHAPASLILRLALLLDTDETNGLFRIFGITGEPDLAKYQKALTSLKYDNDTVRRALAIKEVSISDIAPEEVVLRLLMRKLSETFDEEDVPEILQDGISVKSLKGRQSDRETEKCFEVIGDIVENGKCYRRSQLEISGEDVKGLGVSQGETIGQILNALLDEVIAGEVPNEKGPLMMRAMTLSETFRKA